MAISRPVLLALIGAALLGATFVVVQNARDSSAGDADPAAQQQAQQQAAVKPAARRTPDQTLSSAFSTEKLDSASFDARLRVGFRHKTGTIALSGAFESTGKGKMPALAIRLHTHAPGSDDLNAAFVSTGDKAWFVQRGTGYRVPQAAWSQVVEARRKAASTQGQPSLPFNPRNWLRDVKSEGTRRIDGVQTEHVSAAIDAPAAVHDLLRVAQQSGDLATDTLPAGFEKRIGNFVKRADFDVYVGSDDRVLRRFKGNLRLKVPGAGPIDARLTVDLTKVGRPQRIEAPARSAKTLPDNEFGQLSRGVLSGIAAIAGADATAVRAATANGPRRFKRALDQRRRIVLFFGQGADDDAATAAGVHSLRRDRSLEVIQDDVSGVDAYGKLVERLGVDQAPAVVIVDRRGKARLFEGFVDPEVLRQAVTDAR